MTGPRLSFAFLREGTSDDGLLPHRRTLMVRAGASEASGTPRDYPGPTATKLQELLREEVKVDLIFVHRDSDARSSNERYAEIRHAAASVGVGPPVVTVVPVQAIEAWLLLDSTAIRAVVGKPSGGRPLKLPQVRELENKSDPKAILKDALLEASETTGRRRTRETRAFHERRQTLLARLDIDGPIKRPPAWQQLVRDIDITVSQFL